MARISIIEECIYICREAKISLFLWGHRGIGKSSLPMQIAKKESWGFIDCRCSQLEASDLRGLPDKVDGRTVFLPPVDMPIGDLSNDEVESLLGQSPSSADVDYDHKLGLYIRQKLILQPRYRNGILFLDELNRAQDDVLQSVFQLLLDGKIGMYALPPGWSTIAAGNFMEGYQVTGFTDPAFLNRFCHVIFSSGESTLEEWVEYMTNVHGESAGSVIEFATQNVKHLDGDIKGDLGFSIQPSRRSWEMVIRVQEVCSRFKHSEDAKREVISGLVGRELAISYMKYSCPVKPRDLINSGVAAHKKSINKLNRGQLVGLMWGLVSYSKGKIDQDAISNVCLDFAEYLAHHSSDKDIVVAFCRALIADDKDAVTKISAISNKKLANLLAAYNKRTGGAKTFIDRLSDRKILQEIIADIAWGKDSNE